MKGYLLLAACFLFMVSFSQEKINDTDEKGWKQGKWVGNYENGKKRYEGNFMDNHPSGTFLHFYETGEKKAEMVFSGNGKMARTLYFHPNGMLMGRGNYIDQKKDGIWLYYDDREILSQEENYLMGKREGLSKTFYVDGTPAEEKSFKNNVEHGYCKQFFKNGQLKYEAVFVDGNPDGKVVFYHPNGQIKSAGNYQYAVKNGEWISYNEDGSVYTIELFNKGNLIDLQKKNGIFTALYSLSGNLKEEIAYKNGMKNGMFKEYYDIAKEPQDTIGKTEDEWETLYSEIKAFENQRITPSPKVKKMGTYLDNRLEGELIYYDTKGAVEKVELYKEGMVVEKR